ncbi:MAG: hypothetical protein M1818_000605 [Claussenomyces sp. TS43310]|nr:MAG: hypothetical protein M1818_000605 [Claussenomyces sp. TS43310]
MREVPTAPPSTSNVLPSTEMVSSSAPLVIPKFLSPLPRLTTTQKSLLQHFMSSASSITSCHSQIQEETCRGIVPMALKIPSLFSAIMALSQIHKDSYNTTSPASEDGNRRIQQLSTSSMQSLRQELQSVETATTESTLATILTLCMCDIHTGGNKSQSWRVHFDGARALLTAMGHPKNFKDAPRGSTRKFLERWYISIEALAALTAKGLPTGQLRSGEMLSDASEDVYLDDYFGFSTDLISVFREIGAAAWERRRMSSQPSEGRQLSEADFEEEINLLERLIKDMISRDDASPPRFYPGVAAILSEQQMQEFALGNKAYQHTALIHLYRRVRQLPASSVQVQDSVKTIIECTSAIKPSSGLSPCIVLTTPLFTAGCEAIGPDRAIVADLLSRLYRSVRVKNIQQALDYLQLHWKKANEFESKGWVFPQGMGHRELLTATNANM